MGIYHHDELFAGKTVVEYTTASKITQAQESSYRLSVDYDSEHTIVDLLSQFLADPHISEITSLIIGQWDAEEGSSETVVNFLVDSSQKLPNLTALFLGDITGDEYEISWIQQSDLSPLWAAYPQLEYLRVRGNENLSFGEIRLDRLKTLIVETGGLSVGRVKEICQGYLPQLQHLELWLGTNDYGGDTTVEDLAPILSGELFPYLQYLGLRNSEIADRIAAAVANSTILVRIKILDLSLGNLGDIGATALLASPFIHQLDRLDLHHHYLSESSLEKLAGLSIAIDISDPQSVEKDDDEEYRYIAVSE